jgi:hypothetical protein
MHLRSLLQAMWPEGVEIGLETSCPGRTVSSVHLQKCLTLPQVGLL